MDLTHSFLRPLRVFWFIHSHQLELLPACLKLCITLLHLLLSISFQLQVNITSIKTNGFQPRTMYITHSCVIGTCSLVRIVSIALGGSEIMVWWLWFDLWTLWGGPLLFSQCGCIFPVSTGNFWGKNMSWKRIHAGEMIAGGYISKFKKQESTKTTSYKDYNISQMIYCWIPVIFNTL